MEIGELSQELRSMISQLEQLCPGHDWHYEPGDRREDTVRRSFKAHAPVMLAALGRQMGPLLALLGPEDSPAWTAIVTAGGTDLRPVTQR